MEKDNKKEYEKPELIEHENLNEITKGESNGFTQAQTQLIIVSPASIRHIEKNNKKEYEKPELTEHENLNEVTKSSSNTIP